MSRIFEKLKAKRERLFGVLKGVSHFLSELSEGRFCVPDGIKKFYGRLKGLGPLQKLFILSVAVCLPAGFIIAAFLIGFMKGHKKSLAARLSLRRNAVKK